VIDKVRSPHSLDLADLDGDGGWNSSSASDAGYHARSGLLLYKTATQREPRGSNSVVDDRFEHHDVTRSLGGNSKSRHHEPWLDDSIYVHLGSGAMAPPHASGLTLTLSSLCSVQR
jgi:hypothetical protein